MEADKKRKEKMNAEKLKLENIVRQMQRDAEKQLAPLRLIELLQEEIVDYKKTIECCKEEISALKLKER